MDIDNYFKTKKQVIETDLKKYLPKEGSKKVISAMEYSVLAPGKRFRPILLLATVESLGEEERIALSTTCAIEFIHTSTLILDDLPAMDNSDYRRGIPACHKVFGEAATMLAGAALNTLAFDVIINYTDKERITEKQILEMIKILSFYLGISGVVGGQADDLEAEGKKITAEKLKEIHLRKTASLIKASVLCGGIISRASDIEMEALSKYGEHLGLLFQITDDILDETGSFKKMGKKPWRDLWKKKATYPSILGLPKTRELLEEEASSAKRSLEALGERGGLLSSIVDSVKKREA